MLSRRCQRSRVCGLQLCLSPGSVSRERGMSKAWRQSRLDMCTAQTRRPTVLVFSQSHVFSSGSAQASPCRTCPTRSPLLARKSWGRYSSSQALSALLRAACVK